MALPNSLMKMPLLSNNAQAEAPATQSSSRRNRRRHAATAVSRKRNANLPYDWSDEDTWQLAAPRYRSSNHSNIHSNSNNALATTANMLHVRWLQEVFPSLDRAVLQDVLVAARFEADVAAAMLGELVRDLPTSEAAEVVAVAKARTEWVAETAVEDPPAAAAVMTTLEVEPLALRAGRAEHPLADSDDLLRDDEDWSEVSAVAQEEEEHGALATSQTLHGEWEVVASAKGGEWGLW